MDFSLDTGDPVIAALLRYAGGDKALLELAMHNALGERKNGALVTVKSIKEQIDRLQRQKKAA